MKLTAAHLLRVSKAAIMAEATPLLAEKIEMPYRLSRANLSSEQHV